MNTATQNKQALFRHMTLSFTLSLSLIGFLSILIYIKLDKFIAIQALSAETINISGQQRMLSQRSSLFAYDFITTGSEKSRSLVVDSLNQMLKNHQFLLAAHKNSISSGDVSPLSADLQAMYFMPPLDVDAKVKAYEFALTRVIYPTVEVSPKSIDTYEFMKLSHAPLLDAFNAVVKQYEVESNAQIQTLRFYLNLSTIAVIALLLFIAIFIKRPMVNRISSYAKEIEESVIAQMKLIDGLAASQDQVKEKNRFLKDVMNNTGQGIVVFTKDLKLSAWNDTFKKIMDLEDREYHEGMSLESFFTMNMSENVSYNISIDEYVGELRKRIKNRLICDKFTRDRKRQGGQIVESTQRILDDGSVINTYKDVTAERKEELRIHNMALKDGLTGLANRRAFDAQMDEEIRKFKKQKIPFLLAYIDLDNFKVTNDTYGHNAGDAVLKFVADTINVHIRSDDIAVRLGGDEFAIIFGGTSNIIFAKERLELIIATIKNKKQLDSFDINVGASAGLASCPGNSDNAQNLMGLADKALYSAKAKGKGKVSLSGETN